MNNIMNLAMITNVEGKYYATLKSAEGIIRMHIESSRSSKFIDLKDEPISIRASFNEILTEFTLLKQYDKSNTNLVVICIHNDETFSASIDNVVPMAVSASSIDPNFYVDIKQIGL